VQYRVSGPDIQTVRDAGADMAGNLGQPQGLGRHPFDWNEPRRVLKVDVLQDKARQLGITSESIASALNSVVGGATITQVRDAIYLINVVAVHATPNAARSRRCRTCSFQPAPASRPARGGRQFPLRARAADVVAARPPADRHVARRWSATLQPATVVNELNPSVKEPSSDKLPAGYGVVVGGSVEESGKARGRSRRRAADAVRSWRRS
jgi:multidrug efflux pump subunit AcrB